MMRRLLAFSAVAAVASSLSLLATDELDVLNEAGGLDGLVKMKVKVAPAGVANLDDYYAKTAGDVATQMGCGPASRVFTPSGKKEAKSREWGFDRWYATDCGPELYAGGVHAGLNTAEARRAANKVRGAGAAAALEKARVAPQGAGSAIGSLDVLEPGFSIELTYVEGSEDWRGGAAEISAVVGDRRELSGAPDDAMWAQMTNCETIDCEGAWAAHPEGGVAEVVVQVLDTGLDLSHEEHQVNIWEGPDCDGDGSDSDANGFVDDCHGYNHADDVGSKKGDPDGNLVGNGGAPSHGTHCGGTIAASRNNELGIAGLAGGDAGAGGIRLMTSVGFGKSNTGGFADAIKYGADAGAWISSNSWGYTSPGVIDQSVQEAIDWFNAEARDGKGGIVVFAAGNSDSDGQYFPAASTPCPTISGMIAVCWSANNALGRQDVLDCLYTTAKNIDDVQDSAYKGKMGAGQVNGGKFVECCANGAPSPKPTISPAPTKAPTSSAPTVTPNPTPYGCGPCDNKIQIAVTTDKYPSEIEWKLKFKDADEGAKCRHGPSMAKGGPYSKQYATFTDTVKNVCDGVAYELEMTDVFGDGLCCLEGDGAMQVTTEDAEAADGVAYLAGPYKGSPATGNAECGEHHEGACKGGAWGSGFATSFTVERKATHPPSVSPHPTAAPVEVCYGDADRIGDGNCDDAVGADSDDKDLYNNEACGWDGGDCCKCTCEGLECGGRAGRNYARCKDPAWVDKNGKDYRCDGSTAPPSPAPAPTAFDERATFLNEHLIGISWYPSVAVMAWQVKEDDAPAGEFTLELKDVSNGGSWQSVAIAVKPRTNDGWYTWTGIGDSVPHKDPLPSSFPFDCSTNYLARESWYFNKAYKDCHWLEGRIVNGANLDRLCSKTNTDAISA
ncbi:serine-type endopeptidase [Aureococcus anophagefferens]|nr:serine-type endopeptidase [Aureococcus anophagefferens]